MMSVLESWERCALFLHYIDGEKGDSFNGKSLFPA